MGEHRPHLERLLTQHLLTQTINGFCSESKYPKQLLHRLVDQDDVVKRSGKLEHLLERGQFQPSQRENLSNIVYHRFELGQLDDSGNNILHLAARYSTRFNAPYVNERLKNEYRAFLTSLRGRTAIENLLVVTNSEGYTPMQVAMKMNSFIFLECFPLPRYKTATRTRSNAGETTLALACRNGKLSVDLYKQLVTAEPGAAGICDSNGDFPLHLAARHIKLPEGKQEILENIGGKYAGAWNRQNDNGETVLHCIFDQPVPDQSFYCYVAKKFPDAWTKKKANGETVLHCIIGDFEGNYTWRPISDPRAWAEAIQYAYHEYPQALSTANDRGETPFQLLCSNISIPPNLFDFLLKQKPDGWRTMARDGQFPLHNLNNFGGADDYSLHLAKSIIEKEPWIVRQKDLNGNFPLHTSTESGMPDDVLLLLHEKYPEAAMAQNEMLQLPLHLMSDETGLAAIEGLYHTQPRAFTIMDREGNLPLHVCMKKGMSVDVVKWIYDRNREAATTLNKKRELPLHAVGRYTDLEAIEYMYREHPEAYEALTESGDLPLHCAVKNNAPQNVLSHIHLKNEKAIKTPNIDGMLPLHCARFGTDIAEWNFIYSANEDAIRQPTRTGDLPLHCTLRNGASCAIISHLLVKNLHALGEPNHQGDLPLHCSVSKTYFPDSRKVFDLLVESFPEALHHKNGDGNVPLHCFLKNPHSFNSDRLPVQNAILRALVTPEAVQTKNRREEYPLHCLVKLSLPWPHTVQQLYDAHPPAAGVVDPDGHLPLVTAASSGMTIGSLYTLTRLAFPNSYKNYISHIPPAPLPEGQRPSQKRPRSSEVPLPRNNSLRSRRI